jgi:hypothetical protein
MNRPEQLAVTTHVGRDILQSADLFRHPERVVWEYVVNGLEYTDPGTSPRVLVSIQSNPRRITIADNGRGMDRAGLVQFFTMHAENTDRAAGKPGRGFFGTGKSAAFAIANVLRLDTVRNGRRSIVELHRADVEATSSGDPVPVQTIQMEAPTSSPNGTVVTITDFRVSRVNRGDIIRLIERNLRHMGRGVSVVVDGAEVEPHVPPIAESRTHTLSSTAAELNGAVLTLHVAKAPLVEEDRGVAILSNGNLHEITLGTASGKSMSQYIFGEIDIPALAAPHKGVAAYDMSRSGQLNPENELVLGLYAEISRHVETLRQELVERENIRKRAEEAEKLQSQADEIARLINQDYLESSKRFRREQADAGHGDDLRKAIRATEIGDDLFVPGGDEPAIHVVEDLILDADTDRPVGPDPREPEPAVEPAAIEEAETTGHSQPAAPSKRHPSGGFKVQYRENGSESPRAFYEKETRIIYINLDHPQVVAAKGDGDTEEPTFKRLSYEIAFTEYAIGLAKDYADNHYYSDFDEPLFDIRDRIDRLARRASGVFSVVAH